jgi:hypothetical protein
MLTLAAVTIFSVGKSWLRFAAIRLVLHSDPLDRQFWYQMTLWLFTPAIFFINCIAALLSKKIRWRGTEYEMISPTETKVLPPAGG